MTFDRSATEHSSPRTALEAAIRAPSPHNAQPWRFEVADDRIHIFLDPERVLAVADPDAREARLACGAAIFNIRTALAAAGLSTQTVLLAENGSTHLGTVMITGTYQAHPADLALAEAMWARRSNRRPFVERPVPAWIRHGLQRAADAEGAHLYLLRSGKELRALATELQRAELEQAENPNFQDELRQWTISAEQHGQRLDGVPAGADSVRATAESVLSLRSFVADESKPERSYESEPLVAVLSSYTDTPMGQLRCGQAMQHVLLLATASGVSASFLSQVVEVPSTRAALQRMLRIRHPQAVLRFGYGHATPSTPRRPVPSVTAEQTPEAQL